MVLERIDAHCVHALSRGCKPAHQLLLAYYGGTPRRWIANPPGAAIVNSVETYSTGTNPHVALLVSKRREHERWLRSRRSHQTPVIWLSTAQTLDEWSRRLDGLEGSFLGDLTFWDQTFIRARVKFQMPGVHATFRTFFNSGHGPSETISLYNSSQFPSKLLPRFESYDSEVVPHGGCGEVQIADEVRYLKEFCSYIQVEYSKYGRKPPEHDKVYQRILSRVLSIAPELADEFNGLMSLLEPSRLDIIALILGTSNSPRKQEALRGSSSILSRLTKSDHRLSQSLHQVGRSLEASEWEKALAWNGHSSTDHPIAQSLTLNSNKSEPSEEEEMPTRSDEESSYSQLEEIATDIERHFPQGRFKRSEWTDEKSARIYATRFLSLNSVLSTLKLFDVRKISSASIREILLRCVDGSNIDVDMLQDHFQRLKREHITVDRSVFCQLVQRFTNESEMSVLHHLATTDIHPTVFDDPRVLNSILLSLDPVSDALKRHLIISALLVNTPEAMRQSELLNIGLRASVTRDDDHAIHDVLDKMRTSRVLATDATLRLMYDNYVGQHQADGALAPARVRCFTELLFKLLENGSYIQPAYWDHVLRALLLSGALDAHEQLCIRITSWYKDNSSLYSSDAGKVLYPLKDSNTRGVLFRPQCVSEILMHYMYYGKHVEEPTKRLSKTQSAQMRAGIIASHPVLRGLRLLIRLRDYGVDIDIDVIHYVLRMRIWLVCRRGFKLTSGLVVSRLDNALERDYHLAAEILLGVRDPVLRDMRYRGEREKSRLLARNDAHASSERGSKNEALPGDSYAGSGTTC